MRRSCSTVGHGIHALRPPQQDGNHQGDVGEQRHLGCQEAGVVGHQAHQQRADESARGGAEATDDDDDETTTSKDREESDEFLLETDADRLTDLMKTLKTYRLRRHIDLTQMKPPERVDVYYAARWVNYFMVGKFFSIIKGDGMSW